MTSYPLVNTNNIGNNWFWALSPATPANIDLLALGNGVHTISASVDYTYNWWNGSSAQVATSTGNGSTSTQFTVIPEPSITLLGVLSVIGLLTHRRR